MTTEIAATTIMLGPEMPSWIVWDDLSPAEEATLRRMWDESVDRWLEWATSFLDSEPASSDFSVPWDLRYTSVTSQQLAELRSIAPGAERRECLYRILGQPADHGAK